MIQFEKTVWPGLCRFGLFQAVQWCLLSGLAGVSWFIPCGVFTLLKKRDPGICRFDRGQPAHILQQ